MARTAELLGDRWTLLILREAFYGVQRYDDMLKDLGAPRAMLTDRLNKLVEAGILARHPYQEPGSRQRHAYRLTGRGAALAPMLIAMTEWGEAQLLGAPAPVDVVDQDSGAALRLALVDERGAQTCWSKARLRVKTAAPGQGTAD